MKVLILAGGHGTRISEESGIRPKPMVEIGGFPILWHIMKGYSKFGYNDFVILCGYKGYYIKEFFSNYFINQSSITFDLKNNTMTSINSSKVEPWKITLLDTGLNTFTGGRIKQAQEIVGNNPFLLTYGDGVADIDISATVDYHIKSKKYISMTAVRPVGRFGTLQFHNDGTLSSFKEKSESESGWINGGFFVCEPQVFNYIDDKNQTIFERDPLERLTSEKQINVYKHNGFWKCMDTLADKRSLNKIWDEGEAKWKIW